MLTSSLIALAYENHLAAQLKVFARNMPTINEYIWSLL